MEKQETTTFNIKIGICTDDSSILDQRCIMEAERFFQTGQVDGLQEFVIAFWTEGIPELICKAICRRNETGKIKYELDYSECTL